MQHPFDTPLYALTMGDGSLLEAWDNPVDPQTTTIRLAFANSSNLATVAADWTDDEIRRAIGLLNASLHSPTTQEAN